MTPDTGPTERADPAITKTLNQTAAQIGDLVVYTITVTNLGNIPATDVVVTDTLPPFLALESAVASRGTVTVSGATVTVDLGDLAPQEVVTITITARVVALATPPNNQNLATVSSTSPTDDPSNNTSSIPLTTLPGDPDPVPTQIPPPAVLPPTSAPPASTAWLIMLGLLCVALSVLLRSRQRTER
jgi:uncharacterized repeat protein (TIGR01451 family)